MTLCPIALVIGCKKCFAYNVCPVKGIIGDEKDPKNKNKVSSSYKRKR